MAFRRVRYRERQRIEAIQRRLDRDTAWMEKTYPGIESENELFSRELKVIWISLATAAEFCSQVLAKPGADT